MLFSGYICLSDLKNVGGRRRLNIKKLLIRALTKSPGVSTSGLSFFAGLSLLDSCAAALMVATLTHSADQHFDLLGHISSGKFDGWDGDVFQAYRSTACVTNKVNVIVMVLST